AQRHGRTGTATRHHAAYMIELSKAWALDPRRPVWLQEVGAPAPLIPAEHAAAFTEETIAAALDCQDVWGVTWWCSHDVSRDLADFPELEYSLGLLTNDGQVKPAGAAIARIAEEWRGRAYAPATRTTALVVDDAPARRSACAPGGAVFEAFARLVADGVRPTVVLASRVADAAYLAARGITEVVSPEVVS
ncbi:glycosyl hydrolase, partial [Streptomyces sp. NPDC005918]